MANSIIDDMLKNQVPNKEKKSGGSKLLLVLILLLVIALIGALVYVLILKTKNKMTPKDAFITYLGKGNMATVFNLEKLNTLNSRMQTDSSTSTTEITGDISSSLLEIDLDLSELKVQVDAQNSPMEGKNDSEVFITYKDNEILSWKTLGNTEDVGVILNDVIIKYVGTSYDKLGDIIGRLIGEETIGDVLDFATLKDTRITMPKLSNEMFLKYIDVINQKVPETEFTTKDITLDRASGNINVTEYSVAIKESQAIEIVDLMLQTLENDDVLLNTISASFNSEPASQKEEIKEKIESYINSLYDNAPDDTHIYTIKVYGANDTTYKVSIDFYGEYTIDIDYDYAENNNGITVTCLETEAQSGYSLEIIKKTSDVSEKLEFTLNLIDGSEIVGKLGVTSDLVSSGNSYTLKNTIEINYSIFNINIRTNKQISFREVEIEDLTGDNCIFLDELDQDTFEDIMSAIIARTAEVINENLVSQGEKPIIKETEKEKRRKEKEKNAITGEISVNQPDNTNTDNNDTNSEELKEAAKNKLITYVGEAMTLAQNEERSYTLEDLMVLEIPDSTLSVAIEDDVATVNIDGFEFKINAEFQLYE